jgi:cysteine desulfurase
MPLNNPVIYLDNNATTQPSARVVEAMLPYLTECYFNASASTAAFTGADKPRCEAAAAMAMLLNAEEPDCFTFTSGATESNNWVFSSLSRGRKAGRVLISAIEHASVAEPAAELARVGFEIVEAPVDAQGVVRLDALRDALREDTALVSIMAANNETGVLEPVVEIGRLIRERCPAALFHTDATQAVGKIPVDLQGEWQDVDLLSFSAHKFHGPKGIGGLYIRPGIDIEPMLFGGGQEDGLRSGTSNTPALAGLAASAIQAAEHRAQDICDLRDFVEAELRRLFPGIVIHSNGAPRLPNTSCFSIPGVVGEDIVRRLAERGVIIGTGAACSSGAIDLSKNLRAMSVSHDIARSAVRVSLSASSFHEEAVSLLAELRIIGQPPTHTVKRFVENAALLNSGCFSLE